uniref:Disease resistance protein RPS2-like n=1 Tax=Elaeis guineensis var. tenera TaxID=51953 RepID=A0A6I9QDB1_ELAGV|nr:disease resistance protein RPS2-like [Elaeis guineensis]
MADPATGALLCEALNCICPTVWSHLEEPLAEEIRSFLSLEKNWSSLQTEIENLQATQKDLDAKLQSLLVPDKVPSAKVTLWQERATNLPQQSPTRKDYENLGRCLCRCTPNLLHRYRLGKKVRRKLQQVIRLDKEGNDLTLVANDPQQPFVVERPTKPTFGMDSVLERLWTYFDDEDNSIIGIWGLGGVGKTTLVNEFNNALEKKRADYHVVINIEVSNSETLNVVDIQQVIADRLGLPWNDNDSEILRAKVLLRALKETKFVLLLDDVWKEFSLEDVGIPTPNRESHCKLIIASRSEDVCINMGARQCLIEMQCLEEKAAWKMFCSNLTGRAEREIGENNDIRKHAVAIFHSCEGLPLALNVVGRAVAGLKDPREWRRAAKAISRIPGVDDMFAKLKYSYDRLDDMLQQCFLYCTLFPDYGSIKKDQLVDYWIAEGLIAPATLSDEGRPTHHDLSDEGYSIIGQLISKSLLQSSDMEKVKMHHIIRRLGRQLVDPGRFLVQAGQALEEAPEVEDWRGFTRISLMSNDLKKLPDSPNCRNLLTLLIQQNPNLEKLSSRFFRSMSSLRVLDLSYTAITELPGIDALAKLEYLNLCYTRITALPKRLWVLKQLRHLNLSKTSALKEIPNGTISKLNKLRVLNIYRSNYGIWEVEDLNLDELRELDILGITIYSEAVLKKLRRTDPLAKSTHLLSLKYCERMESILLSGLKHMEHLQELHVDSCNELKELIAENNEQEASCLKVLTLAILPNLEKVSVRSVRHHLQNLCKLSIHSCPKLEEVTWVLHLESLERLIISDCHGMENIVEERISGMQEMIPTLMTRDNGIDSGNEIDELRATEEQNGGSMHCKDGFCRLKTIILKDLPKLESICHARDFACLESIRVEACPNLKGLPLVHNRKLEKLKQICGSRDWWNNLVWEENTKAIFSARFTPI